MVRNSGASDKPIVFQAENRGGVVLTGGRYTVQPAAWFGGKRSTGGQFYITLKGLIFRDYADPNSTEQGAAAVRAGLGWRIEDCLFDRAGRTGLTVVDDNVIVIKSTFQYNYIHAMVAFGRGNGATGPTDTRYVGISGLRLTDVILRGNYTSPGLLDGRSSSSVIKIMGTKGTVVDNMESYENSGPGLWFDADNFNYVVRNSYFHNNYSNPGVSPGRGLHLELNWGPALVENNVMNNNAAEGVAVSNSWGVEIRNNLLVGNKECVRLSDWVNRAGSVNQYALHDVSIHHNLFKDWMLNSCINPYGDRPLGLTRSSGITYSNIYLDYNTYQPRRNPYLSGWWADKGFLTTISQARAIKTETERIDRAAPVAVLILSASSRPGVIIVIRWAGRVPDEAQLPIARTKRGDERRHVSIRLQPTEALHGFPDAGGHPRQHHLSAAPALDVPLHVTCAVEQTLGGVGRRQGSPQAGG